jgi:hypothetical protein
MKPVAIRRSTWLDRPTTWNEVMWAISLSTEGTLGPFRDSDDLREANSEFSVSACNLPEGDRWLAIAREMPDSKRNQIQY